MKNWIHNKLRIPLAVFFHDLFMIPLAWMGSYWLRFNLEKLPADIYSQALFSLPIVFVTQGFMFWYFGLYRGLWRFASIPDLMRIMKAVVFGVAISAIVLFLATRLENIPRSVFILDAILLILLLGGPRFVYRWAKDRHLYTIKGRKILIVGAGRAGEMLVRDLLHDPLRTYQPTAFVDDDPSKVGKDVHGIQVIANCDALPKLVKDLDVELVLIALASATSKQIQRVVGLCESAHVAFRILPRMQDLVSGQVSIKELRDVKIDDLLGREVVTLDWDAVNSSIQSKRVFVTGGGGSIGAELSRQIAKLNPSTLIIYEKSEFNLYSVDIELRKEFPKLTLISILGDITDQVALEAAISDYKPHVIFHAAAYKHVPMLENQVRAAVVNNILGTQLLASLADKYRCNTFVMISTDKAVNPTNIMGASKRVAELFCQNFNANSETRFITVRFGNVLASAGSVIPLFQKQIAAGGPVTVTHPEITRYFMTIPEATQLILQAAAMGQGGEIFVLDMGEPVKISYLAEQLILLSGKTPEDDIEIVYTGLRPGEKLFEELFHEAEKLTDTNHPKILLAQSRQMNFSDLQTIFQELGDACALNDAEKLRAMLHKLVPEHTTTAAAPGFDVVLRNGQTAN